MNENLNLVEILKDCPKDTKLYSTIYGDVTFELINENKLEPIVVRIYDRHVGNFSADGKLFIDCYGDCTLFPSKDQRDWSKFKPKKPKFDPKTLKLFDKVLVKDITEDKWECNIFSHIYDDLSIYPYCCVKSGFKRFIPYNDDTKYLIGTNDEAPEFYRYWED